MANISCDCCHHLSAAPAGFGIHICSACRVEFKEEFLVTRATLYCLAPKDSNRKVQFIATGGNPLVRFYCMLKNRFLAR